MTPVPKRSVLKKPKRNVLKKKELKPESKRAAAIKAPHMLKFGFCCPDSPYFRLTQPERKAIEAEFVAQLAAIFPAPVREKWSKLAFPLLLIGPKKEKIELEPDMIDEQRQYLALYFEHKLRELTPTSKPPPGMPEGSPRLTVEDTPDDPCVMCIVSGDWHMCIRCWPIEEDGKALLLTKETRLGLVEAQVYVQLGWDQSLKTTSPE